MSALRRGIARAELRRELRARGAHLEVDEELGALEVARGDAHVVLALGVVELGEAPVDEAELALLVVDHHVVRLDVAVHDAVRVAELERLEQLENVVPDVEVGERRVQHLEVGVVHVLEDERRRLRRRRSSSST